MTKLFSGWREVPFEKIADSITERVNPATAKTDVYVGLEHLDPETIHLRRWGHPSDVEGDKLCFRKGDIIFGRRRAYQRKLAVADFDGICSAHALVVRAKPEAMIPELMPFFLQSDQFMERAISISVGSLSPTINWKTLKKEKFLVPAIEKQKAIAELMWGFDETIERLSTSQKKLENLESIFQNKFALNYPAKKIELGKMAKFINGSAFKAGEWANVGIPIIRIQNLNGGMNFNYLDSLGSDMTVVKKGDLLFGWSGSRGTSFGPHLWNGPTGVLNQHIFKLECEPSVDPKFLYLGLKALTPLLEEKAHGSAGLVHIKKSVLTKFVMPLPPYKIQERIGKLGLRIAEEIEILKAHKKKTQILSKNMLGDN